MALIVTVSKSSVSLVMRKLYNITLNMTLKDDAVTVLSKNYSVEYRPGDSIGEKETYCKRNQEL